MKKFLSQFPLTVALIKAIAVTGLATALFRVAAELPFFWGLALIIASALSASIGYEYVMLVRRRKREADVFSTPFTTGSISRNKW